KLKLYALKNINVKAVVAVDFAGHPCNWEKLKELQDQFGFQLVNDFCHAPGAEYNNNVKYAPKYADAVNMSFHPVKHFTTGEGGAVLTNNSELDKRVRTLRTHGMTKDESVLEKNDGPWYYEMHEVGFNYRITDFQCALGLTQLSKLSSFVEKRRDIAKYYNEVLADDERFILPQSASNVKHAYHLYPLQIKFDEIGITRKDYFARLRANRILAQVHYVPVHLQPFYMKNFGFMPGIFPIAEKFYEREISIPMYASLDKCDLEYISSQLIECLS
ncbi:MAG: DegT/DnrJ/EryC1/StrS family aminotransferase, partial [Bacteroidota bacterium]